MPAFAGMTIGGFHRASSAAFLSSSRLSSSRRHSYPVIPAKAGIQRLQSHVAMRPWMPACAGMTIGGFRRTSSTAFLSSSRLSSSRRHSHTVIPAKAGIQRLQSHAAMTPWIPAFAGMTFWQGVTFWQRNAARERKRRCAGNAARPMRDARRVPTELATRRKRTSPPARCFSIGPGRRHRGRSEKHRAGGPVRCATGALRSAPWIRSCNSASELDERTRSSITIARWARARVGDRTRTRSEAEAQAEAEARQAPASAIRTQNPRPPWFWFCSGSCPPPPPLAA